MTSQLLMQENPTPVSTGEDDMRQYLSEIRAYPRLTTEQERELAMLCAAGDEEAIRKMVNSNLRLVVSVAREYAGRGVPLMDLIQEGSIGLLTAARKFDYTLDFRFSTYATKWIRQGITRCLASHGLIRVPPYTADKVKKIQTVRRELLQKNGAEPTAGELAAACDLPEQKLQQILQFMPDIYSLDAPFSGEDGSLSMLLEDLHAPQPYEELIRRELLQTMDSLMSDLNERQRTVLRLHFGMEDGTCYSLEQIGEALGVSKERARQIERQAMDKLQKQGLQIGLEDFLE